MDVPIPPAVTGDDEDVSWALSTASALWGRGERAEALKWLRRAAEAASDANADARALQLFKAAADISTRLSAAPPPPVPSASVPPAPSRPPAPPTAPPPMTPASLAAATVKQRSAFPPPPPVRVRRQTAPPLAARGPAPELPRSTTHFSKTVESPNVDVNQLRAEAARQAKLAEREPKKNDRRPTRRASETGRRSPLNRTMTSPETAPQPEATRARQMFGDDEVTQQRTIDTAALRELLPAPPVASRAAGPVVLEMPKPPENGFKFDEFDEDTRVLDGGKPETDLDRQLQAAIENLTHTGNTEVDEPRSATEFDHAAGRSAPVDHAAGRAAPVDHAAGRSAPVDHAAGRSAPVDHAAGRSAPVDHAAGRAAPVDQAAGPSAGVDDRGASRPSDGGSERKAPEGGRAGARSTGRSLTDPRGITVRGAHDVGSVVPVVSSRVDPEAMTKRAEVVSRVDGSGATGSSVDPQASTQRGGPGEDVGQPPRAARSRIDMLPSVRVALLPGHAPGELRAVVLDHGATPPAGAAMTIVVPLSLADGVALARLLGEG